MPTQELPCGPQPPRELYPQSRALPERCDRRGVARDRSRYLPPAEPTGRPRAWPMREMVNAIFYVLRSGCAWRIARTFRRRPSIVGSRLSRRRAVKTMNHHSHARSRASGGGASPTAAVLDSQSVKTTEAGGPRGYDAGKKVNGRKRHTLVDTDGRALVLQCIPPRCRTATAASRSCAPRAAPFPSSSASSPTAPTPPGASRRPPASSSRSSARIPTRSASRSIHGAGSSNASSPGSAATAALPKTSRRRSPPPKPSCMPPRSCSSSGASHEPHEFRNGLLRIG